MKEKQIEDMAKVIGKSFYDDYSQGFDPGEVQTAEALYNAGYRKQSEGEWLGDWDYECSVCHEYHDVKTNFCPNCGARMKGENNG
jgi:hypothetical protein